MIKLIQQNLQRAQQKMKDQADKKHSYREFQASDWVYLKLQPYVQLSVARRSSQKLGFRYFGPYKIIHKVGKMAYKLELPAGSLIHPVVHVSQLKKAIQSSESVSPANSLNLIYSDHLPCPVKIATIRLSRRGHKITPQGFVQWSQSPSQWSTWENLHALRHRFPLAAAWGQAASQAEGNVTKVEL